MQLSDLIAFLECAPDLDGDTLIAGWHYVFVHARFDPSHVNASMDLLSLTIAEFANTQDGERIAKLKNAINSIRHNRVFLGFSSAYMATYLIAKLYLDPASSDETWATINRNVQSMRQFAQPVDPARGFIGDAFEFIPVSIQPGYAEWKAAHYATPSDR